MIFEKVVVNPKGKTSEELYEDMLKQTEQTFNTGPIIGDAREVILSLLSNLYQRELVLEALGLDLGRRYEAFKQASLHIEKMDQMVLEERAKGGQPTT